MLHPHHHALMFFFIILLFSSLNYSQSLTTHADDERAILLSLKRHWGNPSSLHHWNSTFSPCDEWRYISCNFNGSVTGISLFAMNLQGSFPSKIICQLTNLSSIYLGMNNLGGTIPVGLSTCSKLEELDLYANNFTGKIPGELFSMKTLRTLRIRDNMLSGEIPTPIAAYSLEYLDLSSNHFNGSIPKDIGNLYNLSNLDLSNNSLNGSIPSELFSMKRLGSLNLQYNMLSGEIPTPIAAYSLEDLDLSSNHFNGSIPDDIQNFYSLSYLNLSMNSLTGSIPDNIGSLYNLVQLDLSKNSLSGPIPARLLQLHKLNYLSLASNKLSGEIPVKLDLFSLTSIDLSDNKFSGDICETVSHMWDARLTLRICKNHFSGRIPYELVKLKFVERCFDDVNLCSDQQLFSEQIDMELPICPSQRFSDYTIPLHMNCTSSNELSKSEKTQPLKPNHTMIVTCVVIAAAAVLIIGIVILLLAFRHAGERRKQNDGEEWSIVPFQRLEFNKWEILGGLTDENLIANGGSGKVYRVITKKGQRVAVKSIRHEQKQGHGLMEKQFLAEVKILGRIWHNNIVKLLCFIRGKTTKLLVYEYMDKQCLHKWLHGKKKGLTTQVLHWETRLKIAIGAAQGLCYMHHDCNPPIVHRDIKSSNILVDSDFNVKIADFGLAKMLASEGGPETASAIVGTFGYIAPEYGSTIKVDAKSDIYSFGVVLLELTTGKEAVTGNEDMNLAQWAHKHQRDGKSTTDALDVEIKDPRYLDAMITVFKLGLACTLSTPSSRPSMKDISQILQRCTENNHISLES